MFIPSFLFLSWNIYSITEVILNCNPQFWMLYIQLYIVHDTPMNTGLLSYSCTIANSRRNFAPFPTPLPLRSHRSYAVISRLYHHLGRWYFIGRKLLTDAPCSFYGSPSVVRACPVMCNSHFLHPYLFIVGFLPRFPLEQLYYNIIMGKSKYSIWMLYIQ